MKKPEKPDKDKKRIADLFIKRQKPYKKHKPLNFDLRGYAKHLKEHGISGKDVPPEVVNKYKVPKHPVIYLTPEQMEKIRNTPKKRYDAKKAAREARKELRKQGLWL